MRISWDEKDAGYTDQFYRYAVFLNGKSVDQCVIADEEQGEVIIESMSNCGDRVRTTLYGEVELRLLEQEA